MPAPDTRPPVRLETAAPAVADDPLEAARALARRFARNSRAAATEAAYGRDWADFVGWCAAQDLDALPARPDTVALFLAARASRLKTATLQRRLAAIVVMHRRAGFAVDTRHPVLAEVWRGIKRTLGTERRGKAPLLVDELKGVVACLPDTLAGRRDRALLLLGFAAALRRSEIVALDVDDLRFTAEGVTLRLRRAKCDQEGRGEFRAIPRGTDPCCPVRALQAWLIAARLSDGPLFRAVDRFGRLGTGRLCDRTVARVVKTAVARHGAAAGLTRAEIAARVRAVAGHSLRAGFVTAAAAAGAAEWEIMRQTGHKQRESLQRYIRMGNLFSNHVATKLGL